MKFYEFLYHKKEEVDNFAKDYLAWRANSSTPDNFPDEMNLGEWEEQFLAWRYHAL